MKKTVESDSGKPRTTVDNIIEDQTEDGRITRKTVKYDLNRKVGQGCKLDPDPPEPVDQAKK